MPDWLVHTMIGWMTGKITKIEVSLVVVGSILPDLVKMNHIPLYFRGDLQSVLNPLHTPAGALLVGGILALFFSDSLKAFLALALGIATHFLLDFFLIGATKGIQFLFPLSWQYWRFNEIMVDVSFTFLTVLSAVALYGFFIFTDEKKERKNMQSK